MRSSEIESSDLLIPKKPLQVGNFLSSKKCYESIGGAGCQLKFSPFTLQLPDLKSQLLFLGKNGRPDAIKEQPVLHFGLVNNPNTSSVPAGQPLYLTYDKTRSPNQYVFSPSNSETPLWFIATSQGNEVTVQVSMRNENGEILREPHSNAQFNLIEKDANRPGGKLWEMGKWRVDGSLLARQKARWVGQDKFLERHGGNEYSSFQGKHRIDFADEEETYSVYVGLNDSLIWHNGKWKSIQSGEETLGYPLMIVKKIDERLMNFELWDVGGRGKIPLTLIKINEMWMPQNLQDKFTFLGARTRSQYIFEIEGERMLLSPKDWLLQSPEGWIKLSTPQQIDDFVDRKLTGLLFVFDGVQRKEGRQVLKGVIFNTTRTDMQEVEIVVQQGRRAESKYSNQAKEDEEEEEDEDDELEDEEEEVVSTN